MRLRMRRLKMLREGTMPGRARGMETSRKAEQRKNRYRRQYASDAQCKSPPSRSAPPCSSDRHSRTASLRISSCPPAYRCREDEVRNTSTLPKSKSSLRAPFWQSMRGCSLTSPEGRKSLRSEYSISAPEASAISRKRPQAYCPISTGDPGVIIIRKGAETAEAMSLRVDVLPSDFPEMTQSKEGEKHSMQSIAQLRMKSEKRKQRAPHLDELSFKVRGKE